MEIDSMPTELDEVRRRVMQLEIEREALHKETDPASRERLARLEKELADLKEEETRLRAQWETEKAEISGSSNIKEQLEQARLELDEATRSGDYAKASELQYGRIPQLEKRLAEQDGGDGRPKGPRMLKLEVDEEDIADVVAKWTNIPVSRLMEGEIQKLIHMEERLHHRVLVVKQEFGERSRELGLADAGRAKEEEAAERPVGILQPGARTPHGVRDRADLFVLTDDTLVEALLHVNQLLDFAFQQFADRNVRPLADDLGDVFFVDLFLEHGRPFGEGRR